MSVREKFGGMVIPDLDQGAEKKGKADTKRDLGKVSIGKDVGTSTNFLNVAKSFLNKTAQAKPGTTQQATQTQQGTKAYKHAHFNQIGMDNVNFGQSGAKAMRGDQSILDLKKVVVTPPHEGITPEPGTIGQALEKMGVTSGLQGDIGNFLGQQASWAQQKGMTVEKLKARLKQLKDMIELRKLALSRMKDGKAQEQTPSVALEQAAWSLEQDQDQIEDPMQAGSMLVEATQDQAKRMHYHLAKMMGLKLPEN